MSLPEAQTARLSSTRERCAAKGKRPTPGTAPHSLPTSGAAGASLPIPPAMAAAAPEEAAGSPRFAAPYARGGPAAVRLTPL